MRHRKDGGKMEGKREEGKEKDFTMNASCMYIIVKYIPSKIQQ